MYQWYIHHESFHKLSADSLCLITKKSLLWWSKTQRKLQSLTLNKSTLMTDAAATLILTSLNGFCSVYAMHLGSICYGLLPSLTCNENVPSKEPTPEKKNIWNLSMHFFILLALPLFQLLYLDLEEGNLYSNCYWY